MNTNFKKASWNKNSKIFSITKLIQREITYRILISIFLIIIFGVCLNIYNTYNYLEYTKGDITAEVDKLSDFIISQVLVKNPGAIVTALKEFNQQKKSIKYNIHIQWIKKNFIKYRGNNISITPTLSWTYYHPVMIEKNKFGYLKVTGNLLDHFKFVNLLLSQFLIIFIFSTIIILLLLPISKKIPQNLLIKPINDILSIIKNKRPYSKDEKFYSIEIESIKKSSINLVRYSDKESRKAAIGEVSLQVAHDIRSPLVALEIATKDLSKLTQEQQTIIKDSLTQIFNIANNLLYLYQDTTREKVKKAPKATLLMPSVNYIFSEKTAEIKKRNANVKLLHKLDKNIYSAFVNAVPTELKRILSNLYNNALDAVSKTPNPCIWINVKKENNNQVVISIVDNGEGIRKERLKDIFDEGVSYKFGGNGFGLSHARDNINKWGGKIKVTSYLRKGTTVTINLLERLPPVWFTPEIQLAPHMTIVILDDDPSIHKIWVQKIATAQKDITFVHCYQLNELVRWQQTHSPTHEVLYLCDYQFTGHTQTGLELIKTLDIVKQSILITSYFEEEQIINSCEALGLRLIPKSMVWAVDIRIQMDWTMLKEAVLIDDDPLIHKVWQLVAKRHAITLHTFIEFEAYKQEITALPKDSVVFIDFNLANQVKGTEVAKQLYEEGFKFIYLITGEETHTFPKEKWITQVLDKTPPWIKQEC